MPIPAVEARDLTREYAPGRGVAGVSMRVERGACFALLGRNGSGKSTLTRLVLGLERASSGTLCVLGRELRSGCRPPVEKLGVVLEKSVYWEKLTGKENAWFVARSFRMPRKDIPGILDDLFARADLASVADEPVSGYSFGMRRKLDLVTALCHDPELLVLDEPTIGVDVQFLLTLAEAIRDRSARGLTTWVSGNDPEWAAEVATSVAFMESGRIVACGAMDELIHEVSRQQEIRIELETPAAIPPPERNGVRSYSQSGTRITALASPEPALVLGLISWIDSHGGRLRTLEVRRGTLRDAYLLKTGRTLEE